LSIYPTPKTKRRSKHKNKALNKKKLGVWNNPTKDNSSGRQFNPDKVAKEKEKEHTVELKTRIELRETAMVPLRFGLWPNHLRKDRGEGERELEFVCYALSLWLQL